MPALGGKVVFATGEWEIDLDRRELRARGDLSPLVAELSKSWKF